MSSFAPVILDNGTGYSKIGYAGMFRHYYFPSCGWIAPILRYIILLRALFP